MDLYVQIVDTYEYLKIHIKVPVERGGGAKKTIDIYLNPHMNTLIDRTKLNK